MSEPGQSDGGAGGAGGEGEGVGGADSGWCGGSVVFRVLGYDGDDDRKMTAMDVWALMHPGLKQLSIPRRDHHYKPLPNTHKAVLDCLYKLEYLEHLNLSGMIQC